MDRKLKSATIKRLERELRDAFRTAYKAGHSGLRDYVENMSSPVNVYGR